MEVIFTIVGLTILGMFIRGIAKDKTIADKPKDGASWVIQLIICLVVGAVVWAIIPERCKHGRNDDYDPYEHQRISRDY